MIASIFAALSALAKLPDSIDRLILTFQDLFAMWQKENKAAWRSELDDVMAKLEKSNISVEEKHEITSHLQRLTRRL